MILYFFLFLSFFQIGLFGIGGPDALQAFVESETMVLHKWLTPDQYADLLTLARMTPGETALNAATLTGWLSASATLGFWPAVGASAVATAAVSLPSLLWTAIAVRFLEAEEAGLGRGFKAIKDSVLSMLRPLTPGLMLAAILLLCKPANFGSFAETPWHFWISVFLFLATLIGSTVYRFNALFLVVLCGVAGWLLL